MYGKYRKNFSQFLTEITTEKLTPEREIERERASMVQDENYGIAFKFSLL